MKRSVYWGPLFFSLALTFLNNCADPTTLGSDLLESDRTTLEFFDTISVEAVVEPGEPLTTHSRFSSFNAYLFGDMRDPVFGRSRASIYFQLYPEFGNPFREGNLIIDSIRLILPYAEQAVYGNLAEFYEMDVLRVEEPMPNDQDYLSDQNFVVDTDRKIGSIRFRPRLEDVTYVDYSSSIGDTVSYPHLRVPLDRFFAQEIINLDTTILQSDSLFLEQLRGLKLEPKTVNRGMLGFDIFDSRAGVLVYYRLDELNLQYQLEINSASTKFVNFSHDYTGTLVGQTLENPAAQDSLLFIQGMAGTVVKLSFPHLDALRNQNLIVNKAELELRIGSTAGDSTEVFFSADEVLLAEKNESGDLVPISDYLFTGEDVEGKFGGFLSDEPGEEPNAYRMNISTHMQDMIDGRVPNEVYLVVAAKAERASRSILYGAKHPEYPIKVRMTVTSLSN